MAASTLVNSADVKTLAGISGTGDDSLIDDVISRVSERFEGDVRRKLITATYTGETYDGNGEHELQVRNWPVTAVSSAAIEDEATIDTTDDDVFRFKSSGILVLLTRVWSRPRANRIDNVTLTYTAGYANIAAFQDTPSADPPGMSDAYSMLVDACVKEYWRRKGEITRKGTEVLALSHMGGSISFDPTQLADDFYKRQWAPMVRRHRQPRF